jgi:hypothetical protein
MGHMYYMDHLIPHASREGARYAAKYRGAAAEPTNDQVSIYVKILSGLNYNGFNLDNLTVTQTFAGMFPDRITTVTVSADKDWWVLKSFLGFSTKTLRAQTARNIEHSSGQGDIL